MLAGCDPPVSSSLSSSDCDGYVATKWTLLAGTEPLYHFACIPSIQPHGHSMQVLEQSASKGCVNPGSRTNCQIETPLLMASDGGKLTCDGENLNEGHSVRER